MGTQIRGNKAPLAYLDMRVNVTCSRKHCLFISPSTIILTTMDYLKKKKMTIPYDLTKSKIVKKTESVTGVKSAISVK